MKNIYLVICFCLIFFSCDKKDLSTKNKIEWIVKQPNTERKYYLSTDSLVKLEKYNYFKTDKYFVEEKITGLPINDVSCLFTKNNEIVLASLGKVALLSNNKWIKYSFENSGIPQDMINTVAKDKNGKLYLGYRGSGIVTIYNGEVKHLTKQNSPIIDMDISSILPTENQGVFFTTNSGIMQFKDKKWKIYNSKNSIMPYSKKNLSYVPYKINIGPENKIYSSCGNRIAVFENNKWFFLDFPQNIQETQIPTYGSFISKFALTYVDKSYSKLYIYRKGKWSELEIKYISDLPYNELKRIWDIKFINENEFYIIYYHSIVKVKGNKQTKITPQEMGFPRGTHINCASISDDNNLVIGTKFGFAIQQEENWSNYQTINSLIPSGRVYSVIQTLDKDILFHTYRGISKNNQTKKMVLDFQNSDFGGGYTINCISEVSKNFYYLGTSNGLLKYKNDTLSKIQTENKEISYIHSLEYSKKNDILYIGTSYGLFTYSDKKFEFIEEPNLKSRRVNLIKKDDTNLVYIVYDKSISIYNDQKLVDTIIIKESELPNFRINDIDITDKEILIGTSKGWYIKEKEGWFNSLSKVKKYSNRTDIVNKHANNFSEVSNLIKSNNGKIYLGGKFGTLYVYENEKYKTINLNKYAKINKIHEIKQLKNNDILISTNNGLIIYTND